MWQGEYHMKISRIQQIRFPCINPLFLAQGLAFGAVTVTAGVVRRSVHAAGWAVVEMSAQPCGATVLDGIHGFVLDGGQPVGLTKFLPMQGENILHLNHFLASLACGHVFSAGYPMGF